MLVCIFYTILIKILLKNNFCPSLAENILPLRHRQAWRNTIPKGIRGEIKFSEKVKILSKTQAFFVLLVEFLLVEFVKLRRPVAHFLLLLVEIYQVVHREKFLAEIAPVELHIENGFVEVLQLA